jgi:hypothetical protein
MIFNHFVPIKNNDADHVGMQGCEKLYRIAIGHPASCETIIIGARWYCLIYRFQIHASAY